jgi:ADP-ribose pyrophosphatase
MEEKFKQRLKEEKGKFLHYCLDEVTLANGHISTREMVVHPGAVGIVAVTPDQEVVLVKQYRYPVQTVLYEIPAGKLERGEDPAAAAQRELEEETGYNAEKWEKLTTLYTAPGFSNEAMHLYLATNLVHKKAHPDPDEIITCDTLPLSKVIQMAVNGEIKDGKTVIAVLWLMMRERQN